MRSLDVHHEETLIKAFEEQDRVDDFQLVTQLTFTCSTIETLEKVVNYLQS